MVNTSQIIILILLLFFSGIFSGLETAFYSVSDIRAKMLVKQGVKGAKVLQRLKDNTRKFIITILISNNVVNIGASALATFIAIDTFGSNGVGIATGIMTFLVLIFGEIMPKNIATMHGEKISLKTARSLEILIILLYPLVWLFEIITKGVMALFGIEKEAPSFTEEELRTMIEVGAEQKVIDKKEEELIQRVFDFNDISAADVMSPRVKIFALDENMKVSEAIPIIKKERFSRIPIFDGSVDNITGIINIRDLFYAKSHNNKLKEISSEPLVVSEEQLIPSLLEEFKERHVHIAIVKDEYGGVAGLVTLEDLLEELVGEIIDETDVNPELIKRINKKTIHVDGETEIDEVNDFFNITLSEEEKYKTIAGLLEYELKRIPKVDDVIQVNNIKMVVLSMKKKQPKIVEITKK